MINTIFRFFHIKPILRPF